MHRLASLGNGEVAEFMTSLDRRGVLKGGLAGIAATAGASACSDQSGRGSDGWDGDCVLSNEQTAGPYYLEDAPERSDITEGKPGSPVELSIRVVNVADCQPVPEVAVEIWQCDAWGYYSGFVTADPGGEAPPVDEIGDPDTFLRGFNITDGEGLVQFTTIVPGWYAPRSTHIHLKVHQGGRVDDGEYEGGDIVHTGQLYFADDPIATIDKYEPYSSHVGQRPWLDDDGIYSGAGQAEGLLEVTAHRPGAPMSGFDATIELGIIIGNPG